MKTLIRFQYEPDEDDQNFYAELEGNYEHLDNVWINGSYLTPEKTDELFNLIFDEDGNIKINKLKKPTKDWDYYITCGFYL